MKKIAALALSLLMLFGSYAFVGCGASGDENHSSSSVESSRSDDEVFSVKITQGKGYATPYVDKMQQWLSARLADETTDVATFANGGEKNQAAPTTLAWEFSSRYAIDKVIVEYGVKSDAERTRVELEGEVCTYELYNLYKAATYTWTVTGVSVKGEQCSASGEFVTTGVGPRVVKIDGVYNTRDVGGWETTSGKRVKQGMLYRGGALTPGDGYDLPNLKKDGKTYMSEVLKIKTDLDLRGAEADATSRIPNAMLKGIAVSGYADAFGSHKNAYKEVFSFLADEGNYPVYMHCTGGADRTGTVAFLVNALLGVAEKDLITDYETTSFSIYGTRSTQSGTYAPMFQAFLTQLNTFDGETLSEKTANYMLSIGVTQAEIDAIRNILTE